MSNIILETPRLYLKEFELSDSTNMYKLNLDNDVIKYTGDASFKSIEEASNFIKNYNHYQKYGFGRWSTFIKETNQYIGWCGLKQHENGMVDIGFRFLKSFWNQGFATESAKACLQYGFNHLNINKIVGRVAAENKASVKVLEKIGMTYWKHDECDGLQDALYYYIQKPN